MCAEGRALPVLVSNNFVEDLALAMCVAALTTVIFEYLRQPVVIGYLLAGMVVGPHVPIPLLADKERIESLAELGLILLMFGLGLEFSIRRLVRLGPKSGFVTALQVALMLWLGYVCGRAMGWSTLESVFTGALLSISSTTIVAKAYERHHAPAGLRELIFGVLLAEDLVAVVELAALTALASGNEVNASMILTTVGTLALFLAAMVAGGMLIVPRAIRIVARIDRSEPLLIASIGICFAFAIIAEHAGYSVALGAFLAGSLVAESGEAHKVESAIVAVRDMFGAVFFVSVGMMLDPSLVAAHWQALIVLTVAVIVGKLVGVTTGAILVGSGPRIALGAGLSMAQIGEFSFIIAGLGLRMHAARAQLYSLAIAVSVITTFLTPFLIKASAPLSHAFEARLPSTLRLFDLLYGGYMAELVRADSVARRTSVRRVLATAVCGVIVIVAVIIASEHWMLPIADWIAHLTGMSIEVAEPIVEVAALAICMLPGLAMYRASGNLADALAWRTLPDSSREATMEHPAWGSLREMVRVTAMVAFVMIVLAIVQPFLEPIDGVVIVGAAAIALAIATWRGMRRMEVEMRHVVALIGEASWRKGAGGRTTQVEEPVLAGVGPVSSVAISPQSGAIGKTLRELGLRETGATIVGIARGDNNAVIPSSDELIRDGDIVAIAGPRSAVEKARRTLGSE